MQINTKIIQFSWQGAKSKKYRRKEEKSTKYIQYILYILQNPTICALGNI